MHGRLKIKSTAQQQAEKEAAQKKKLTAYQSAFAEIMSRRESKLYDVDTLKLIGNVLEKNPDVTVLWNYRRDIFNRLIESSPKEEVISLRESELDFIAICLMVNPKSYYAWHHRCWILLNTQEPNWNKELKLTSKFLGSDERNFHCWDYRRWLVQQAHVTSEQELDFVTSKLYDNFSNFSAWHYRSRLIPKIHEKEDSSVGSGSLPMEVLTDEFDMVKNALYVDPQDQSPWFYHRWLLSKCSKHGIFIHTAILDRNKNSLTVAFSSPVSKERLTNVQFCVGTDSGESTEISSIQWTSVRRGNNSSVWIAELPMLVEVGSKYQIIDSSNKLCFRSQDHICIAHTAISPVTFFFPNDNDKITEIMKGELESIRELHSMEDNSKWVILGLTAMLRILSPLETESEVLSLVDELSGIDSLRMSYYDDFKSRISLENQIIRMFQKSNYSFCLTNVGLTRFTLIEWLTAVTEIDLSDNKLKTLPDDCQYLTQLVTLSVNDNMISSLQPLRNLPLLEKVNAQNNRIDKMGNLENLLLCPKIHFIDVRGNGICTDDGSDRTVTEVSVKFPQLTLLF